MALGEIEEGHAVDRVDRGGKEEQQRHRLKAGDPVHREKGGRYRQRQDRDHTGLRAGNAAIGETADDDAAERQDHAVLVVRNLSERQRKGDAQVDPETDDDAFHPQHAQRRVEIADVEDPVLRPVEIAQRNEGHRAQPEQAGGQKRGAGMEIEIGDHVERHRDHDHPDHAGHLADQPQLLPRDQLADLGIAVGVERPEFLVDFEHLVQHRFCAPACN